MEELARTFAAEGIAGDVQTFDDFDPKARRAFMDTLTVMSVPVPNGVAFGSFIVESLAAGVPVVQPRLGSFAELIEATGGGTLYDPREPGGLARALGELLGDPARRAELGRRGRESVERSYTLDTMARQMMQVYEAAGAGRRS